MDFVSEISTRIEDVVLLHSNPENFDVYKIGNLAQEMASTFDSGNKIAFLGNGGSAAEAMHLAAEFTGKCVREHRPLPAICLNESTSAITAIGNDFGFENIFARQIEAVMNEDDILIALSTSGKSRNILNAMEVAIEKKVKVYLWTGNSQLQLPGVEIWNVHSESTPRIQEIHLCWGHILAEVVELGF